MLEQTHTVTVSGWSCCGYWQWFYNPLTLTEENQDGADPLHRTHHVTKENDGAEDGEELPGGGDDGAGQRPEVDHRHEDEGLEEEEKREYKKKLPSDLEIASLTNMK